MGKSRIRAFLIVFVLPLILFSTGHAATISWKLPATYADGTPIPPGKIKKIVMKVYAGPTKEGPWRWVATSMPGATSVSVMDPPPGKTLWYTAKSTLNGEESDYSDLVSKTTPLNVKKMVIQFIRKTRIPHARKIALLSFLLMLIGTVWWIGRRRKRARG